MAVPILTAVTGARWEAQLVAALEDATAGLQVVRRCVDVADVLAAAAAGHGRAAVVSADLHRLDREAVARLSAAGIATVGVVPDGDEGSERRLRQMGIEHVVSAGASPVEIAGIVHAAIAAHTGPVPTGDGWGSAGGAEAEPPDGFGPVPSGRLVAVWGPAGAPGRTTVAVNLAAEVAGLGRAALLADVDTYGGAVAQSLGILDEAAGLAGAVRAANQGQLDLPRLARLARQVGSSRLRVLTGITRTERWPELRPAALEQVWDLVRGLAEVTIADCGFCLEQDEELSFDTVAPQRNGATVTTVAHADVVVAVGAADPVGMQRLIRGLTDLAGLVPDAEVRVVINRVRESVLGADPQRQVRDALRRHAGVSQAHMIPDDRSALDRATLTGRLLAESAPASPARLAIAELACELTGTAPATRRRRWKLLAG